MRIGFSVATDTFIIERWNKDIKVFNSAARELGADVLLQMSAGGTQAQIEQIRYLLTQEIDVLVVLPPRYGHARPGWFAPPSTVKSRCSPTIA